VERLAGLAAAALPPAPLLAAELLLPLWLGLSFTSLFRERLDLLVLGLQELLRDMPLVGDLASCSMPEMAVSFTRMHGKQVQCTSEKALENEPASRMASSSSPLAELERESLLRVSGLALPVLMDVLPPALSVRRRFAGSPMEEASSSSRFRTIELLIRFSSCHDDDTRVSVIMWEPAGKPHVLEMDLSQC